MRTEHEHGTSKHRKHSDPEDRRTRLPRKVYEKELRRLQEELVKMARWVADSGARLVVIFEGRDVAGKGGDKPSARLNCIAHLLSTIPYEARPLSEIEIPARQGDEGYVRPPREAFTYVPDHAATLLE